MLETFENFFKPNGNNTEDEKRLHAKKAFTMICINVIYILWVSIRFFWIRNSNWVDYRNMISIFLIEVIFILLMSRRFPKSLHHIFWLRMISFGPCANYFFQNAFFGHFTAGVLVPLQVLYLTEGFKSFVVFTGFNLVFSHPIYSKNLENMILTIGAKNFSIAFMIVFVFVQVMTSMILYGIYMNFRFYNERIAAEEARRLRSERQKLFLFGFSHEIRNLINTVTGNIQIVLLEKLSPTCVTSLKNAKTCGDILIHLVNNILDTGKAEVGELEIISKKINIHENLIDTWAACSCLIEQKNITPILKIVSRLPMHIELDNYRLAQIIFNIVSNAKKFTDKGSITMRVAWLAGCTRVNSSCFDPNPFDEEGRYDRENNIDLLKKNFQSEPTSATSVTSLNYLTSPALVPRTNNGVLRVDVVDTGSGISEEDQKKLFLKFSQLSNDMTKKQMGTGLGLYINKEIITRMKGDIKVFSKVGKGTAFVFCIPCRISI